MIKFYHLPLSPNSRKVAAVVEELGLAGEVETIVVNTRERSHKSPEFLKLNPNGKLPTLVDGDFALWESCAILTYLAAKTGTLLPSDVQGRARVDQWLHWQNAHYQPPVGKVAFQRVLKPMFGLGAPDEALIAEGTKDFTTQVAILDGALAGKEFICDALSVADFALASVTEYALGASLSLEASANVRAWFARTAGRDSWKRSAPRGVS